VVESEAGKECGEKVAVAADVDAGNVWWDDDDFILYGVELTK
jgi:hypothetical protein